MPNKSTAQINLSYKVILSKISTSSIPALLEELSACAAYGHQVTMKLPPPPAP